MVKLEWNPQVPSDVQYDEITNLIRDRGEKVTLINYPFNTETIRRAIKSRGWPPRTAKVPHTDQIVVY